MWLEVNKMGMDINLLIYWQYGVKNKEFDKMLAELDVKTCSYLYENQEDYREDQGFHPLYLFHGLSYYANADIEYELDDEIIHKLAPYERTAMDIVNRWRRSYSDNENYASIRRITYIFFRFWNDFILKHKINLLILNIIPHIPAEYIPYAICKAYNIPVIIQGIAPFTAGEKTNYILQPGVDGFDRNLYHRYLQIKDKYQNKDTEVPLCKEMKRYFEQYAPETKAEKKVIYYNEKNKIPDICKSYLTRIRIYLKRDDFAILWNKARYLMKTRLESGTFLKKVTSLEESPDLNKKFYIFGLHLQPEATTLPGGGNFTNQLLVIRMVSHCLPKDTYLYVKEHPSYWMQKGRLESVYESRNIEFYQQIKALRNVLLVDHTIPSKTLMEKCVAVITVTGTIGFEALFKGKPVLTFGATFYEHFPSVFRIKTNYDCKIAVEKIAVTDFIYDAREIAIYLHAVEKYIVPMGMNEKSFTDNGVPPVDEIDRLRLAEKIKEFYREYYCESRDMESSMENDT